jgi:hypothetical protein
LSALKAIASGILRALGSPLILLWMWLIGVAVAAPAAWIVFDAVEKSIGKSRVHETLRDGFDIEWYRAFQENREGVAATLSPDHTGVGAFYDNLEALLTGELLIGSPGLMAAAVVYALIWLCMLGGVIDRYANRGVRTGMGRYFGTCGRFSFRFVRLALISGLLYVGVYWLSHRLFDWMKEATEDVYVESPIFYYSVLLWALTGLALTLVHCCFGFAKVVTVIEDRKSVLFAAARAAAFVARHPGKALGTYYGFLVMSVLVLAGYAVLAPGAGQSTEQAVLRAFAVGQLFLLMKLFTRLSLLGAQAALYQSMREPAPVPSAEGEQGA